MNLGLKLNKVPLELGEAVCVQMLEGAAPQRRRNLLHLLNPMSTNRAAYKLDDCEFEGLNEALHIYPCTHGYLNKDRRWNTQVTLYLRENRLERLVLRVLEGRTAAINFFERFACAANSAVGRPCHEDSYCSCWLTDGARIEARLHPDLVNAEFEIALVN